jgi:hypothetical protein
VLPMIGSDVVRAFAVLKDAKLLVKRRLSCSVKTRCRGLRLYVSGAYAKVHSFGPGLEKRINPKLDFSPW